MSNFSTHLAVGSVASGLAATVAMASNVVPQDQLLTLTLAGIVGSILPDVDLEKATPSRMLFGGLGVVFAFVTLFNFERQYSIAELWLTWMGVYIGIRYGVYAIFHRRTKHRGIFHSLLAGAVFAGLTAIIFEQAFNEDPLSAWYAGLFVFFGYVVHLTLDEMSSVDFEGKRIKKSLGSALKLFDYNSIRSSVAMAVVLGAVLVAAPPLDQITQVIKSREVWSVLRHRMWPEGEWFQMRMAKANATPTASMMAHPEAVKAVSPGATSDTAAGAGAMDASGANSANSPAAAPN